MENNTEKSVRQIAEFVGMEYNRVRSKLNDMGVRTNSMETKISLEDEKRFYKEIDFDPSTVKAPQEERVVRSPRRASRDGGSIQTIAPEAKAPTAKAPETKIAEEVKAPETKATEKKTAEKKTAEKKTPEKKEPEKKQEAVTEPEVSAEAEDNRPKIRRRANAQISEEKTATEEVKAPKTVEKNEKKAEPAPQEKPVVEKTPESAPVVNVVKEEKPAPAPIDEKKIPEGNLIRGTSEQETIDLSSLGSSTARASFTYNRQPKPKPQPMGQQQNRNFGDRRPNNFGDRQNDRFNNNKKPDFRDRDNRNRSDDKDFMSKDSDQRPAYLQKSQQGQRPGQRPNKPEAPIVEPKRRDSGRDIDSAKSEKKKDTKHGGNSSSNAGKNRFYDDSRLSASNLSADEAMSEEYYSRDAQNKHALKNGNKKKNQAEINAGKIAQELKNVKIPPVIVVGDFAELIKKNANEVIMKLMTMGVMANRNQDIDFDTAALIADMYGITAEPEIVVSDEELLLEDPEDLITPEDLQERPPVVVVMGHVDHGKTSLLDAIRNTSVTAGEAGGITQHIGAYQVTINGRPITFLDTPGHEAFTAMRARGAQVTDVAIIVVAADDGVMPQTIEAINHAKAANVSIVVAVNKIDKEGANLDRVKNEMAEQGIVCEDWGGDVPFIPVSAKQGTNIDELLETVILSADILQLQASPTKQCKGTVIEAKLDKNKGPVATLLVQRGTLCSGDSILTESTFGHIRTMTNDKGRTIKVAGPSTPVEVTGLPEVPEAGKVFYVVNKDERLAKKVADERIAKKRQDTMSYSNKVTLEDLFSQIKAGEVKNLDIVVKTDVKGTAEAVKASLEKIGNDEVRVRVIHAAVGGVNESDVLLAEASNAIIIGFNVRPVGNVSEMAKEKGVDVKFYRVIYDAINDVKAAIVGMLKPEFKESVIGHVEIRKTFRISGVGTIAGGYVQNGKVVRNSEARIVRDGVVIYEGHLASLKRFKDDVKEVASGFECGLSFEKFDDLKEGDVIESYVMEEVARTIE